MNPEWTNQIVVTLESAQVSDRRCPGSDVKDGRGRTVSHLLGEEVFWCLTCNKYANDLAWAEQAAHGQQVGDVNG